MQVVNKTPFPSMKFSNENVSRGLFEILIVKATYRVDSDFKLELDEEQEPLNFTDHCFEDFNTSSLLYPSDLVPYKPNTDIIVQASSFAPSGQPEKSWECGVKIDGDRPFEKRLRVHGPRAWKPSWIKTLSDAQRKNWQKHKMWFLGWQLGEAEPCLSVPLRYEHAFGGMQTQQDNDSSTLIAYEMNPLGCGWIDKALTPPMDEVAAPQIEAVNDPIVEPFQTHKPTGFGAIPPAWLPRRPLGGTFDDKWLEDGWPHWPSDYKFAFHNSAPQDMQYDGHMQGDETLTLTNLWSDRPNVDLQLLHQVPYSSCLYESGQTRRQRFCLDTVYVDMRGPEAFDIRICLTWRMVFSDEKMKQITIKAIQAPADMAEFGAALTPNDVMEHA